MPPSWPSSVAMSVSSSASSASMFRELPLDRIGVRAPCRRWVSASTPCPSCRTAWPRACFVSRCRCRSRVWLCARVAARSCSAHWIRWSNARFFSSQRISSSLGASPTSRWLEKFTTTCATSRLTASPRRAMPSTFFSARSSVSRQWIVSRCRRGGAPEVLLQVLAVAHRFPQMLDRDEERAQPRVGGEAPAADLHRRGQCVDQRDHVFDRARDGVVQNLPVAARGAQAGVGGVDRHVRSPRGSGLRLGRWRPDEGRKIDCRMLSMTGRVSRGGVPQRTL